jgi:cysteinyl-tRNA synthetase
MLMSHYRSPLNYSGEILNQAKAALERLSTARANLDFFMANGKDGEMADGEKKFAESLGEYRTRFCEVMDDDLNTADAVAVVFDMVREINTAVSPVSDPTKALAKSCAAIFDELADVLGLPLRKADEGDAEIERLIAERQAARKAKNYAEADRIRDKIKAKGYILEDTPQGVKFHKA